MPGCEQPWSTQHSISSRRMLPCQGSLLPRTPFRFTTVGAPQAGWVLTLAGGRFPSLAHSPWGAGTLLWTTALGSSGFTLNFTPYSSLHVKGAIMPCPSDGAAWNPSSGACPSVLHYGNCETPPEQCYRLWDVKIFWGVSRTLICIALLPETYCVADCEDFSHHEFSAVLKLPIALNFSLPPSSPVGACRQCPQPCCTLQRSCSWAELSLQCCLVAMSSLHPRSPAQLSSRRPAQGITFSAPSGLPPCGRDEQAEGITNVLSLSQGEILISSSGICPIRKVVGHMYQPVFSNHLERTPGRWHRRMYFLQVAGCLQLSAFRHFIWGL